jgi:hypothetical protein
LLDAAIAEARKLADRFNADARHTEIGVYALKGRIAETDEEATRAIASEVRGLLSEMETGIRTLNVKSIRDAATKARGLAGMLESAQADTVTRAIESARVSAREIVRRVERDGEAAERVLASLNTGAIEKARFAFLDSDAPARETDAGAPLAAPLPSVTLQRFADLGVDLAAPPDSSDTDGDSDAL